MTTHEDLDIRAAEAMGYVWIQPNSISEGGWVDPDDEDLGFIEFHPTTDLNDAYKLAKCLPEG